MASSTAIGADNANVGRIQEIQKGDGEVHFAPLMALTESVDNILRNER